MVPNYSMQFLTISIFTHIAFGCLMLTNESLFVTHLAGFETPEFPVNPNKFISKTTGIEYEESVATSIMDEETTEDKPPVFERMINSIQGRLKHPH